MDKSSACELRPKRKEAAADGYCYMGMFQLPFVCCVALKGQENTENLLHGFAVMFLRSWEGFAVGFFCRSQEGNFVVAYQLSDTSCGCKLLEWPHFKATILHIISSSKSNFQSTKLKNNLILLPLTPRIAWKQ